MPQYGMRGDESVAPFRSFLRAPRRGSQSALSPYALAFPSGASFLVFALHHFIALLAMPVQAHLALARWRILKEGKSDMENRS